MILNKMIKDFLFCFLIHNKNKINENNNCIFIQQILIDSFSKSPDQNIDKLLQDELDFLQNYGLQVNPKSYGVWNQRRHVMLMMKSPNWFTELKLCNLFLQYDERNCKLKSFHYEMLCIQNHDYQNII